MSSSPNNRGKGSRGGWNKSRQRFDSQDEQGRSSPRPQRFVQSPAGSSGGFGGRDDGQEGQIPTGQMIYKTNRTFRHHGDIKTFVCLLNEIQDKDVLLTEIEKRSKQVTSNIASIVESRITTGSDTSLHTMCFFTVIVPFCKFLADNSIQNAPMKKHVTYLNNITMSDGGFLEKLFDTISTLNSYPRRMELPGFYQAQREEIVGSFVDIIIPIIEVFKIYMKKVTDSGANKNLPQWYSTIESFARSNTGGERLGRAMREVSDLIAAAQPDASPKKQDRKAPQSSQGPPRNQIVPLDESQGPGNFRNEGPRHDNDHDDYKNISIMPTHDEMTSKVSDYLPHPDRDDGYFETDELKYLDRQFRLMRYDMTNSIRKTTRLLLQSLSKMTGPQSGHTISGIIDDERIAFSYFHNLRFVNCSARNKRIQCVVSFDHPQSATTGPKRVAKRFWETIEGRKIIEHGQLVIIVTGIDHSSKEGVKSDKIFYANISGDANIKQGGVEIPIDLITPGATFDFLETSISASALLSKKRNVIAITRNNNMEMYQPILKCIQSMNPISIPFSSIICSESSTDIWDTPNFISDESFAIVKTIFKDGDPRKIPLESFEVLRDALFSCKEMICLDDTQIESYALGMTRKVALIQGPPGTGKTYVGLKLIISMIEDKVLKDELIKKRPLFSRSNESLLKKHASARLPILCICYTNHALDQFLEGLVDAGIPLDKVVRIGGRSKSERLAPRTLGNIQSRKEIGEDSSFRRFFALMKVSEEALQKYVNIMGDKKASLFQFMEANEEILNLIVPDCLLDEICQSKGFVSEEDKLSNEFERIRHDVLSMWLDGHTAIRVLEKYDLCGRYGEKFHNRRLLDTTLWNKTPSERKAYQEDLSSKCEHFQKKRFAELFKEYEERTSDIRDYEAKYSLRLIKSSFIVGATTSGCARYHSLIKSINPQIVMCEEAGEVLESHVLSAISEGVDQLIMIGDHLQLRPKVNEYRMSIDCPSGYGLDLSLFERLVRRYEKVKMSNPLDDRVFITAMDRQRRMTPSVSSLIRNTLYPKLIDSPEVEKHPKVRGLKERLWFFDHSYREDKHSGSNRVGKSAANTEEAIMIIEFLKYLSRQGYSQKDMAIITPYLGQLYVLRKLLKSQNVQLYLNDLDEQDLQNYADDSSASDDSNDEDSESDGEEGNPENKGKKDEGGLQGPKGDLEWKTVQRRGSTPKKEKKEKKPKTIVVNQALHDRVRLATVDNFQGEEADVVIVSTVRNNIEGHVGFLKIPNRVNVMLSRAKHGMFIFGSVPTIKRSEKAIMFNQVIDELIFHKKVGSYIEICCLNHGTVRIVRSPSEFKQYAPDGGCDQQCVAKLKCGHDCPRLCHPDDSNHDAVRCLEACRKNLSCGHPCESLCGLPCGACTKFVTFTNQCGHESRVKCKDLVDGNTIPCMQMVRHVMPYCKHAVEIPCRDFQAMDEIHSNIGDLPIEDFRDHFNSKHVIFSCKKECGQEQDGCFHLCKNECGSCYYKSCEISSSIMPGIHLHAKPCAGKCAKPMICGHVCNVDCHPSQDCPPCRNDCIPRCEHKKCKNPCSYSCALCSEQCSWSCRVRHAGQQSCELPCAIPCERLPCDFRCTEELTCGHQCPSLCGEPCPSPKYCHACGTEKSVCVDGIGGQNYASINLEATAVLVLDCGHFFTAEYLDMVYGIRNYYKYDGQCWVATKELPKDPDHLPLECPTCQMPFRKVNRYNRLKKHFDVVFSQIKYLLNEGANVNSRKTTLHITLSRDTLKLKSSFVASRALNLETITKELTKNKNISMNVASKSPFYILLSKFKKEAKLTGQQDNLLVIRDMQMSINQVYAAHLDVNLRHIMMALEDMVIALKSDGNAPKAADSGGGSKGYVVGYPAEKILQYMRDTVQLQFTQLLDRFEDVCEENKLNIRLSLMRASAAAFLMKILGLLHEAHQANQGHVALIKDIQSMLMGLGEKVFQNLLSENSGIAIKFLESIKGIKINTNPAVPLLFTEQESSVIVSALKTNVKSEVNMFGGKWRACAENHVYCASGKSGQANTCSECGLVGP